MSVFSAWWTKWFAKEELATRKRPDLGINGEAHALPTPPKTLQQVSEELWDSVKVVKPLYPVAWIDLLTTLSITMPDLRQAVSNIVLLGNTGHSVDIYADTEGQVEKAAARLEDLAIRLFPGGAGADGLVSSGLAQIARTGALSWEWVPTDRLDAIDRVCIVPVSTIRFSPDDKAPGRYRVFQLQQQDRLAPTLVPLSPGSFLYWPLETIEGSPYPVPPLLAALWPTFMQREMLQNLGWLVKKFGLIGFVEVMVRRPEQRRNETEAAYRARVRQYIADAAESYKETYRSGMVVGFEGEHTFKVNSVTAGAQGVGDLWQLNEEQVFSGVNSDPAMHGRRYSTTEAFASVIYRKQCAQIESIRRLVKRGIEHGYNLDLLLSGLPFNKVRVSFNDMPALDPTKMEEQRKTEIANVIRLRDEGIISQEEAAIELGFDGAAEEVAPNPHEGKAGGGSGGLGLAKRQRKTLARARLVWTQDGYRVKLPSYTIQAAAPPSRPALPPGQATLAGVSSACSCGKGHGDRERPTGRTNLGLAGDYGQADFEALCRAFLANLYGPNHAAVDRGVDDAVNWLMSQPAGASDQELLDGLYKRFEARLDTYLRTMTDIPKVAGEHVSEAYKGFRTDDPAFTPPGIRPRLDMADQRAIDFLSRFSNHYLGKYATNPDFRAPFMSFIQDKFLDKGLSFKDARVLADLRVALGDKAKDLTDYQLQRIVRTTLSTTRVWANLGTLDQAGATTYEVVGPNDRLICPVCSMMLGRVFSVPVSMAKIQKLQGAAPEDWPKLNPFATEAFRYDAEAEAVVEKATGRLASDIDDTEMQSMGFDAAPYHPQCRHRMVARDF